MRFSPAGFVLFGLHNSNWLFSSTGTDGTDIGARLGESLHWRVGLEVAHDRAIPMAFAPRLLIDTDDPHVAARTSSHAIEQAQYRIGADRSIQIPDTRSAILDRCPDCTLIAKEPAYRSQRIVNAFSFCPPAPEDVGKTDGHRSRKDTLTSPLVLALLRSHVCNATNTLVQMLCHVAVFQEMDHSVDGIHKLNAT